MKSFSELPADFFMDPKKESCPGLGLLWLPPLNTHPFTQMIDWLSGMQISKLTYKPDMTWTQEVSQILRECELDLDEAPQFKKQSLVFNLPPGFKARFGLVMSKSKWLSTDHVYASYIKSTTSLNPSFIQSPFIWSRQHPLPMEEVQWIPL